MSVKTILCWIRDIDRYNKKCEITILSKKVLATSKCIEKWKITFFVFILKAEKHEWYLFTFYLHICAITLNITHLLTK